MREMREIHPQEVVLAELIFEEVGGRELELSTKHCKELDVQTCR